MTTLNRVRVSWQSWPGAPGVSTFYTRNATTQAQVDAIRAMFNSLIGLLPSGLLIQVPSVGDTVDSDTGLINGSWTAATTPASVVGTAVQAYAGNAGAVINWQTALVLAGRRVRGRTFLVPLVSTAYDTTGSLSSAALTTIQTAANSLVAALGTDFVIYSKPRPGGGTGVGAVISARVPDLAVTLRSRRT